MIVKMEYNYYHYKNQNIAIQKNKQTIQQNIEYLKKTIIIFI